MRRNGRHVRTVRVKIDRCDRIGLREARNRAKALMSQIQSGITEATAAVIRGLEEEIRRTVIGELTLTPDGTEFGCIAGTAATLYIALFSACRELAARFKSSNLTWLRKPREGEERVHAARKRIVQLFAESVRGMGERTGLKLIRSERFAWQQSMSRINPHTKGYNRPSDATESVLCFAKA